MKSIYTNSTSEKEILQLLELFQDGYTKRDLSKIDSYMKDVFIDSPSLTCLGTNRSEFCFGVAELKELIESDWEFWGNLKLMFDTPLINFNEDAAWFAIQCSIKWDDEEDFEEWCDDLVSEFFEDGRYINYTNEEKLGMINQMLTIIQYAYHNQKGTTEMPIRLTGTAVRTDGLWLISDIQFSAPMTTYPEWRLDYNNPDSLEFYELLKKRMKENHSEHEEREEILALLNSMNSSYLNSNIAAEEVMSSIFSSSDDVYSIDPNEIPLYLGGDALLQGISCHRDKWDDMDLTIDGSIINVHGNTATIFTNGIFKKKQPRDQFSKDELTKITEILKAPGAGHEKLFKAQRQVSYSLKELCYGEDASWEFRFQAVAVKENGNWKLHNIFFSYPVLYMIEGNYDNISLLQK